MTSRSGSLYGNARMSSASTAEKTAVLAPMPSANVTMATAVKPGAFRMRRNVCRRSAAKVSMDTQTAEGAERLFSAFCFFIEIIHPLLDERGLRTAGVCVRVGIGVRHLHVVSRTVHGCTGRMDGVEPLDGHVVRIAVVVPLLEVALQGADRFAATAEGAVQHCERFRETRVGRPLADGLFENAARLGEFVRAQQRAGEPLGDLRQIGAVHEGRLPAA